MTRYTLQVPATPPSLNQIGYRSHWGVGRRHKQQWQQWLWGALLEQRVPKGLEAVEASATIRFRQRRRRDSGNFRAILEKALGDTLQQGWISDDTPEHYEFGRVELVAPSKQSETIIVLDCR